MTDLAEPRALLGPAGLLEPGAELSRYERAPNLLTGTAAFVARPAGEGELTALLDWAHRERVRLIPQGANSGLVGGALPDGSGTQGVLSGERLRDRFELDTGSRTLTVSAGWQLDEINERLASHGLQLPVEVGSSPSVGGMLSTNTAGSHLIKYGDVRHRVLGLRAAVPDGAGTVLDLSRPLRKRNEGLDLKQVFIGTGGTLGVITEASFELAPLPRSRATAWLAVPESGLLDALTTVERHCADSLAAFEVVSPAAAALLTERHEHLLNRIPRGEHFLVLAEIAADDERAEDQLTEALEAAAGQGLLHDARIGAPQRMWEVRHAIPEITERMHPVLSLDLATPRSALTRFRAEVHTLLAEAYPDIRPIELGHYGDGGIHLILPLPQRIAADRDRIDELRMLVYDLAVHRYAGSFSAEHGIGPKNHDAYLRFVPEAVRTTAALLKRHFDPHTVLAPLP
ncbi:FAD-binding oxidoreductase [Sciscionella marina]|uniref:FAD-binding oxidoreductase n=1 Tax=Sciscionella marina TaxID=508770 RepID=UPI000374277C|nr:FAD-binding oxidoreductase [Sciscionella marina]